MSCLKQEQLIACVDAAAVADLTLTVDTLTEKMNKHWIIKLVI